MAIEEAKYDVIQKDGPFEIREYAPHILAETVVGGELAKAGNKAFRRLFQYITGNNHSNDKVAMTAPVSQQPSGESIKMTAPVGQQGSDGHWAVSFMMPASYTIDSLPVPADSNVSLRQVPAQTIAAVRYSGFWSQTNYSNYKAKLESWMKERGLHSAGEPIWARYNSPFMPWFWRRNEILIPFQS